MKSIFLMILAASSVAVARDTSAAKARARHAVCMLEARNSDEEQGCDLALSLGNPAKCFDACVAFTNAPADCCECNEQCHECGCAYCTRLCEKYADSHSSTPDAYYSNAPGLSFSPGGSITDIGHCNGGYDDLIMNMEECLFAVKALGAQVNSVIQKDTTLEFPCGCSYQKSTGQVYFNPRAIRHECRKSNASSAIRDRVASEMNIVPICKDEALDHMICEAGSEALIKEAETHCGGVTIASLTDGTPYAWAPPDGKIQVCKDKCFADPNCEAFVWQESTKKCFWKSDVTATTGYTFRGLTCYSNYHGYGRAGYDQKESSFIVWGACEQNDSRCPTHDYEECAKHVKELCDAGDCEGFAVWRLDVPAGKQRRFVTYSSSSCMKEHTKSDRHWDLSVKWTAPGSVIMTATATRRECAKRCLDTNGCVAFDLLEETRTCRMLRNPEPTPSRVLCKARSNWRSVVTISAPSSGVINLAAIEAYDAAGERIKPVRAEMSTNQYLAKNCTDANTETYCRTKDGDNDPWVRVTFNTGETIATVVVENRRDCCQDRIDGATLSVSKGGLEIFRRTVPGDVNTTIFHFPGMLAASDFHALEDGSDCRWGYADLTENECREVARESGVLLTKGVNGDGDRKCWVSFVSSHRANTTIHYGPRFVMGYKAVHYQPIAPSSAMGFHCKIVPATGDLESVAMTDNFAHDGELSDGDLTTSSNGFTLGHHQLQTFHLSEPMMLMRVHVRNKLARLTEEPSNTQFELKAWDGKAWSICENVFMDHTTQWITVDCKTVLYAEKISMLGNGTQGDEIRLAEVIPQGLEVALHENDLETSESWTEYSDHLACDERAVLQTVECGPVHVVDFGGNGCTKDEPCGVCGGDCDKDEDCAGSLKCFHRSRGGDVPGCQGGSSFPQGGHDFCYEPSFETACADPEQHCRELGLRCWGYAVTGTKVEFYDGRATDEWICSGDIGLKEMTGATTFKRNFKQIHDVASVEGSCWKYEIGTGKITTNIGHECTDGELGVMDAFKFKLDGLRECAAALGWDAVGTPKCYSRLQFRENLGPEMFALFESAKEKTMQCEDNRRREESDNLEGLKWVAGSAPRHKARRRNECQAKAELKKARRCSMLKDAMAMNADIAAAAKQRNKLQEAENKRQRKYNTISGVLNGLGGGMSAIGTAMTTFAPSGASAGSSGLPPRLTHQPNYRNFRRRAEFNHNVTVSSSDRRRVFPLLAVGAAVGFMGSATSIAGGAVATFSANKGLERQLEIKKVQQKMDALSWQQSNLRHNERIAEVCLGASNDQLKCSLEEIGLNQEQIKVALRDGFANTIAVLEDNHVRTMEAIELQTTILHGQTQSLDDIKKTLNRIREGLKEIRDNYVEWDGIISEINLLRKHYDFITGEDALIHAAGYIDGGSWCDTYREFGSLSPVTSLTRWMKSDTFRDLAKPDVTREDGEEDYWTSCEKSEWVTEHTKEYRALKSMFEFAAVRWMHFVDFKPTVEATIKELRNDIEDAYARHIAEIVALPEGIRCVGDEVICPAGHHPSGESITKPPCVVNTCTCPEHPLQGITDARCVVDGETHGCKGTPKSKWHPETDPSTGLKVFHPNQAYCAHGTPVSARPEHHNEHKCEQNGCLHYAKWKDGRCHDERSKYQVVTSGNCESKGKYYITTPSDCKRAGEVVGINKTPTPGSNRPVFCGTWDSMRFLHYNQPDSVCEPPAILPSGGYHCVDGCLNGNTGYADLATAWAKCGEIAGCVRIMKYSDGKFYLRKANDRFDPNIVLQHVDYSCKELTCSAWPSGGKGDLRARCLHGNTLNDGYVYVFNGGRGTSTATCGNCWCCRTGFKMANNNSRQVCKTAPYSKDEMCLIGRVDGAQCCPKHCNVCGGSRCNPSNGCCKAQMKRKCKSIFDVACTL